MMASNVTPSVHVFLLVLMDLSDAFAGLDAMNLVVHGPPTVQWLSRSFLGFI